MQDINDKSEIIKNVPLIPLRDLVVFPSTLVPFIIGRHSSVKALEMANEKDKMIFLSAQMDASVDDPTPKDVYSMGVMAKIIRAINDYTYYDEYIVPNAESLVIAYGVTARAARAAVKRLQTSDRKASLLVLKTLWPVPEALIREKAAAYQRVVMAEMNLGQYVRELQRLLPGKDIGFMGQMNGELIKPGQIMEVIEHGLSFKRKSSGGVLPGLFPRQGLACPGSDTDRHGLYRQGCSHRHRYRVFRPVRYVFQHPRFSRSQIL